MKLKLYSFCVIILLISGCIDPPTYPDQPAITFKSVSRTMIQEGDTVIFTIKFTDGNGDIGPVAGTTPIDTNLFFCKQNFDSTHIFFRDPAFNVYFLDLRDSCWSHYASAYIEPKGKFDDLSGEIDIIVGGFCKKFPPVTGQKDTLNYQIFIKDRASNFSNLVKSDPVVISCN